MGHHQLEQLAGGHHAIRPRKRSHVLLEAIDPDRYPLRIAVEVGDAVVGQDDRRPANAGPSGSKTVAEGCPQADQGQRASLAASTATSSW